MIMKIFIVIICLGVFVFIVSLLPDLHFGNQMSTRLFIQNLSFYDTNIGLPTLIGFPAGSYILSNSNMGNSFSVGGISEIPKDVKLKVDVPDKAGLDGGDYSRLSVIKGRNRVLYKGKIIQGFVLLHEGDSIRIRTDNDGYIVLCFNYKEG